MKREMKNLLKKMRSPAMAVLAIAIAACVSGSTLISTSASSMLPGLEKTVSDVQNSQNHNYHILEIVPKAGLGEIGYYAEGEEYNYLTPLLKQYMADLDSKKQTDDTTKGTTTQEERQTLYNEIIKVFEKQKICTADAAEKSNYPLYSDESDSTKVFRQFYFPTDADIQSNNYQLLEFPDGIEENVLDYGTFAASSESGKGAYDLKTTEDNEVIPAGAASLTPESLTLNPIGGYQVTFAKGPAASGFEKYGVYTFSNNTVVRYEGTVEESQEASYYYVSSIAAYDPNAAVDPNAVTARCSAAYYQYVGTNGSYDYTHSDSTTGIQYQVTVNKVYYQCSLVNNNWLKKYVFGFASPDAAADNFNIIVDTKTPGEVETLTEQDLVSYDFIYLCGNNLKSYLDTSSGNSYLNVTYEDTLGNYSEADGKYDNDISFLKLRYLFGLVADASMERPCIVDYSILSDADAEGVTAGTYAKPYSNIYKLTAVILQNDLYKLFIDTFAGAADDSGINWSDYYSTVKNDNSYNYVNKNVYCFEDLSSDTVNTNADLKNRIAGQGFTRAFSADTVKNGFFEISEMIASENAIRTDSADMLSTDVSQSTAVQYIINYLNRRIITKKMELNVLEIEPCASYDLTAADVKGFNTELESIPNDSIKITQMTTAEFIGKIDDLNTKYDLVYIGANVGKMYTDSEGSTTYNDNQMNGLIYTHVGDQVYCKPKIGGLLDTDYTANGYLRATSNSDYVGSYRYSGNDITTTNLKQLEEFISARYAVIVDSSLYNLDENGARTGVNSNKVDNSTNLYTFLAKEINADNLQLSMTVRNADGTSYRDPQTNIAVTMNKVPGFYYYINMPKVQIHVTNYDWKTTNTVTTLYWDFDLSNEAEADINTAYHVNLYFDVNADGRYSSSEKMTDMTLYKKNDSGTFELVPRGTDNNYSIKKGSYEIRRTLIGDYVGELSWKVELTQVQPKVNEYIRGSEEGSMHVFVGEKQTVRILQIMQNNSDGTWNMQKAAAGSYTEDQTVYRDFTNENPEVTFKDLIDNLEDVNIKITSITSDDFVKKFNKAAKENPATNILDDYDMIIMGFDDVYQDISNDKVDGNNLGFGPVTAIDHFIKDGKSVLFTHDTTSFINVSSYDAYATEDSDGNVTHIPSTSYWGYNINTFMRNTVGMDRFGITGVNDDGSLNTTAKLLREGIQLNVAQGTDSKYDTTVNSQTIQLTGNDLAFRIKSACGATYSETQGYTNLLLNSDKLDKSGQYCLDDEKCTGLTTAVSGNGAFSDMYATQVNSGVITRYPFAINSQISIASTHFQYYQLDLEADDDKDQQKDIVVWYTIGGSNTSTTPYTASPNDVRNNYYIYSKGNVMYSGVGHSSVKLDGWDEDLQEAKLFINTIVAAYKNSVQNPVVTTLSSPSVDAAEKNAEYLTYDAGMADDTNKGNLDTSIDLNYSVFDSNLATSDKTITVKYYVKDDTNGVSGIVEGVKLRALGTNGVLTTYSGNTDNAVTNLASGYAYHATIDNPYDLLGNAASTDIYIVVKSSFTYYGKTYTEPQNEEDTDTSLMGYAKYTLVRAQLFNLD